MKITAVVPVWNENPETLTSVLNELKKYVDEIVVIDDGSKKAVSCQLSAVKLIRHQLNRGQGAALQTGTDYAVKNGADIIVHFDGDGQHHPEDIPDLIRPIKENRADFVFGSRFLGKKSNIPWTKEKIILPISKLINKIYAGLKLTDVHNGMRAFRSSIAHKIYLTQDKMAHNSEYPYLIKKNNIKYAEAPIKVSYKEYGQGISGGFKILKELFTSKIIR